MTGLGLRDQDRTYMSTYTCNEIEGYTGSIPAGNAEHRAPDLPWFPKEYKSCIPLPPEGFIMYTL